MSKVWVLKGGKVYREGGFEEATVVVRDGHVEQIGREGSAEGAEVIDCSGKYILPGLVDVHVHLREPGFEKKETIASGTLAAARGGYTTVFSMPNLNPAPDSREHLDLQYEAIRRTAHIRVVPYGTITRGQMGRGELVDFEALSSLVAGFSDDGRGVQARELMAEAMWRVKPTGKKIVAHCEDETLLHGGYIHDGEYCRAHGHRGISSESEWRQVERDLELVEQTGCPYHICHISTKESVELLRQAKAKGLPVSGETGPHYLLLTDEDLQEEGRFKMNPPLRSREDQLALLNGILDGTLEVIATDHAPHTDEEKGRGLEKSAMGIVGIETAFPLLYTYLVRRGVLTLEKLVALMADNPRRLFGLEPALEEGALADLVVMDLDAEYEIDPQEFLSKGRATPFAGWKVRGRTMLTLVGGEVAYRNEE